MPWHSEWRHTCTFLTAKFISIQKFQQCNQKQPKLSTVKLPQFPIQIYSLAFNKPTAKTKTNPHKSDMKRNPQKKHAKKIIDSSYHLLPSRGPTFNLSKKCITTRDRRCSFPTVLEALIQVWHQLSATTFRCLDAWKLIWREIGLKSFDNILFFSKEVQGLYKSTGLYLVYIYINLRYEGKVLFFFGWGVGVSC